MGVMRSRCEEVSSSLEKIGELTPREMGAWNRFTEMTDEEGALGRKRKELIAVALSVYAKCDWCIALHVDKALQLGATKEEIVEAAWVAVLMGGDPALMHAQMVLKALEEFEGDQGDKTSHERDLKKGEINSRFEKLHQVLLSYVKKICDETEVICHENSARRNLAINIARTDGRILERLVIKECNERKWEKSEKGKIKKSIKNILEEKKEKYLRTQDLTPLY